ncbi:hypothetical protein JCM3765_004066 [Sporobolomyces pararoseus]
MSSSSSSTHPPPHPSSTPSSPDEQLSLVLRLATHPVHPSPSTHVFSCSRDLSILGLKERLYTEWDGKPKPDGITLIKGGRVCRDSESVKEVFEDELNSTPQPELVLHVVVRASAWSAPFTSPPPPPIAPPTPSPSLPTINTIPPSPFPSPPKEETQTEVPPPPTTTTSTNSNGYSPSYITSPLPSTSTDEPPAATSTSTTTDTAQAQAEPAGAGNPYLVYLSHLQRLIPIQRSLLLLNLQKAHHYYQLQVQVRRTRLDVEQAEEEETEPELGEVERLLKECGLWSLVRNHEEGIEESYNKEMEKVETKKKEEGEFKIVQLDGLPYLLHTPPSLQQRRQLSLKALKSLSRAESILKILTTMLQLLIVFQPTSPSIAHGRALSGYRPTVVNATLNPIAAGAAGRGDELAILQAAAGVRPPQVQADQFQPPLPPFQHQHLHHPHQHRAIRRAATISITLHLDSLIQFLLPLFFLSLKLAFLLFVFARHASPFKRNVLIAGAVLWVVWEGIRIGRRGRRPAAADRGAGDRGGGRGDRDRNDRDRERRRAAREEARARWHQDQQDAQVRAANRAIAEEEEAQARLGGGDGQGQQIDRNPGVIGDPPPPPLRQRNVPQAQPPQPQAQMVARQQPPRSSSSSSATRREPPSIFSPKYWINSLAAVGLVEEARELGLSPRYIAGRPISPANRMPYVPLSQLSRWERHKSEARRLGRIVWTGFVLFLGTLIPEVERKRKKALEKRERLLLDKKVRWERDKEWERNGGSWTKRKVEDKKEEKEKEKRNQEVERTTVIEGREKISDEELFRDGGSEAFTSSNATASTSTAGGHQGSSSVASTSRAQTQPPPVPTSDDLSPPSPLVPSTPLTPIETDLEDEEGDGDIAASASVSENNSDDEIAPGGARGRQDDRGAEGDGQDGAVVAIF